jgi:hypothetical protein
MKKYVLPCPCGQSVEVDASQAGLQVTCSCGSTLEVPTMRGLAQLQPAASEERRDEAAGPAAWGPAQGLMFLGGLVLLVGLAAVAWVYPQRPHVTVDTAMIQHHTGHLTPEESWELWKELRQGLNQSPNELGSQFQTAMQTYYRHLGMAITVVVVGAALLAIGLMLKLQQRPRPPA